ncbi:Lactosylceramide 4-alpha-galactosyltransferase [Globomyces sp. JEL0801]|nr:Lactosylceramide 4-alpha-galactosyltransferase [Globomyces sp. JEL0801]
MESTMRLNISTEIYTRHPESLDEFPKEFKHLMSIKFLNHQELMSETPLEAWYEKGEWESNNLKSFDLADAVRLAIIYKFGGIYSDLDIILFNRKVLETKNKMAHQHIDPWHGHQINSNFLDFEPKHPFVWMMMEYFVDTYELNHHWGSTGPAVTTGALLKCLHNPEMIHKCQNIERLPKYIFQYIQTGTLRKTLNTLATHTIDLKEQMMKVSYGLHFSNSEIGHDKMHIGGLLHELMIENCPITLQKYENELFEIDI